MTVEIYKFATFNLKIQKVTRLKKLNKKGCFSWENNSQLHEDLMFFNKYLSRSF